MTTQIGVNRNLWRTAQKGIPSLQRMNFPLDRLELYLPLWHPEQQGFLLSYDGNDYLKNAVANFRSADSAGAIEIWFRCSKTGANQTLFSSADEGTDVRYLNWGIRDDNVLGIRHRNNDATDETDGATNVCDGEWHHAVLSSNGTAWSIILNGVAESLTPGGGGNTGDWFADTTLRDNIFIGALERTGVAGQITAEIGFTRVYSREMLVPEALANKQRGRKGTASNTTGLVFNLPTTEGTGNPVDTVGSLEMTVTGATWVEGLMDKSLNAYPVTSLGSPAWGITGRTYAGTEKVTVPSATNIDNIFATGGTWWGWINVASDGGGNAGRIIDKTNVFWYTLGEDTGKVKLGFLIVCTGLDGLWGTTATEVTLSTPSFVAVTYDASSVANDPLIYVGTTAIAVASKALTETQTPANTQTSDAGADMVIGNRPNQGAAIDGIVGEIGGQKGKILTAVELESIRLATRWRYV